MYPRTSSIFSLKQTHCNASSYKKMLFNENQEEFVYPSSPPRAIPKLLLFQYFTLCKKQGSGKYTQEIKYPVQVPFFFFFCDGMDTARETFSLSKVN